LIKVFCKVVTHSVGDVCIFARYN